MLNDSKSKKEIPVNEPVISNEAKQNVAEALSQGWISSAGPHVAEFETAFAKYLGVKHAIAVSNGTAALHTALLSLSIGQGDEVIVPAFSMGACFLSVLHVNATPVFVDCEPETYNIDAKKIAEKITPRTKAIMVVHTYGHACDMDAILAIANAHNLPVIEDAAEAHGGEYKGKKCGTFGTVGCFSFYANKIITTGEGGMVVTDDEKIAAEARKFRDLYHSEGKRFIHEKVGYNFRMTNLQAALGLGELTHIDEYVAKKQKMAERYNEGLKNIAGVKIPITKPDVKNVFWVYAILVEKEKFGMSRDELRKALAEKGIGTRDFFYPPEEQPVLKTIVGNERFAHATHASQNGLYLPSGLALSEEQIQGVIDAVTECSKK